MNQGLRKKSNQTDEKFQVLIIGKEPKQNDHYSALIRELIDCKIDTMNRIENINHWSMSIHYDLVVIDHHEARILLERVKRTHPECSVIVVAERSSIEESVTFLKLGAEDYLKKPVQTDLFRLAVQRGIDGGLGDREDLEGNVEILNLIRTCQLISASLEGPRILSLVKSYLSRELKTSFSATFGVTEDGDFEWYEDYSGSVAPGAQDVLEIALRAAHFPKGLTGAQVNIFVEPKSRTPGLFVLKFRYLGEKDAFFVGLSPKLSSPVEEFELRLKMLRAQIDVTCQNIARYKRVQEMAYVDDVTELHNTRYLNGFLDREIEKAKEKGTSFSILFVDADKFKSVNDSHGHVVGSKLLKELGGKLKGYVRDTDALVRYGGDEFVVVLCHADIRSAHQVAERVRSGIENHNFLADEGLNLKVTVSIGVASYPLHAKSKEEIIEAADQAMYCAKNRSRNCVFAAEMGSIKSEGHG